MAVCSLTQRKELLRVGGYAGTGKTTVFKDVYRQVPGGSIVAFMGKACDVLNRKGLPGQTIHSLIYKWDQASERFYLVEPKELDHIDWIGVDEGSMVGSALWSDLVSYGKPIVVFGDPGQLEPVNDDDPHLMRDPDITLTEIHRQALNNPIIQLSLDIRLGNDPNWNLFRRDKSEINSVEDLLWPDIIICGFNKSRLGLNKAVRLARGFNSKLMLTVGERIICRNNDKMLGVFNGQMFTVVNVSNNGTCLLQPDYGPPRIVTVADVGFNSLNRPSWGKCKRFIGKAMIADYGYAITCHSSQGSEWPKVAYIDEQCDLWCPIRHRYTGYTRASEELRIYMDLY